MRKTSSAVHILFLCVWLAAAIAGYSGLNFGGHWDEGPILRGVQRAAQDGRFLPDWYNYPSTTHNLVMLCALPDLARANRADPPIPLNQAFSGTTMRARGVFLGLSMLAALWIYLAVLAWGRSAWEALLAAALLAGSWEVGYQSRWIAPDGLTMQFSALFIWATIMMLRAERRYYRWLFVAAAAAGLACGSKYTGGVWFVALLAVVFVHGWHHKLRAALLATLLFAGTVVATTPGVILDTGTFIDDVFYEMRHYGSGHEGYSVTAGPAHAWLMLQYIGLAVFSKYAAVSMLIVLLAVVGAVAVFRRDRRLAILVVAVPILFFIYMSGQSVMLVRNLLLLLPALAILAARGAAEVGARLPGRGQWVVAIVATAIVVANLVWLQYAASTIRGRDRLNFSAGIVEFIEARGDEKIFVSALVQAELQKRGTALDADITTARGEADVLLLSLCDGFDRKAWPANRYGAWRQINGTLRRQLRLLPDLGWGLPGVCHRTRHRSETRRHSRRASWPVGTNENSPQTRAALRKLRRDVLTADVRLRGLRFFRSLTRLGERAK